MEICELSSSVYNFGSNADFFDEPELLNFLTLLPKQPALLMKWMVNQVLKKYLALRMKRIERYMQHPEEAQERWLRTLLETAKNTEFGQKYNFADLKNANDFARLYKMMKSEVNEYNYFDSIIIGFEGYFNKIIWI